MLVIVFNSIPVQALESRRVVNFTARVLLGRPLVDASGFILANRNFASIEFLQRGADVQHGPVPVCNVHRMAGLFAAKTNWSAQKKLAKISGIPFQKFNGVRF